MVILESIRTNRGLEDVRSQMIQQVGGGRDECHAAVTPNVIAFLKCHGRYALQRLLNVEALADILFEAKLNLEVSGLANQANSV